MYSVTVLPFRLDLVYNTAEAAGIAERAVRILASQVDGDAMTRILSHNPAPFEVQEFRQVVSESLVIFEHELSEATISSFLRDMYVSPSASSSMMTTNSERTSNSEEGNGGAGGGEGASLTNVTGARRGTRGSSRNHSHGEDVEME